MRILVTGGAGFIGSHAVAHLLNAHPDYRIVVLDALTYAGRVDNLDQEHRRSGRLTFQRGDIRNGDVVARLTQNVDAVVHFAAETHVARSIYANRDFFDTDVIGTQVMVNAALDAGVSRFIHISSSEVYGTAESDPMNENHPLKPRTPYASAKAGADRLVYSYAVSYEIPCLILRPFNNYGPRQHLEKVIPRFVTSALLDEPLTVHGAGDSTRDWLHVSDTARAVDAALHADPSIYDGRAINLGTGVDTGILPIAESILDQLEKPRSLIVYGDDRPGQVDRHISSTGAAERDLGWRAAIGLEEGLRATIAWYRDNTEWWSSMLDMRRVPILSKGGETIYY